MAVGLDTLIIYQLAEDLEINVHELTKKFPSDEKYRSVDQLRRSSASVSNNISEGYNRYSYQEKVRYFVIAKGEAEETKRNLIRAYKKGLIDEVDVVGVIDKYTEVLKGISGYIKFLNKKNVKKASNNP